MKTLTAGTQFLTVPLFCLIMASCSKEITSKETTIPASANAQMSSVASTTISNAIEQNGFLGEYTVRDEKIVFIGQANPRGTNVFIQLAYLDVQKSITLTDDKKHLTMPYGPSTYTDAGWAYIIDYDKNTKSITLSPNAAMQKDIVAGSFETLAAVYDPKTKEGSFFTRFTALKDNGNETQISEGFWKE